MRTAALIGATCTPIAAPAQVPAGDRDVALAIISECRAIYHAHRPCACPDDLARNGSRCGRRSAHDRPGGAAPLCDVSEVTAQQIADYKAGRKEFLERCEAVQ